MKKIIVLMIVLTITTLYSYESKLKILKGSEYQVCKDYAQNMNLQFTGERGWEYFAIYKFREFKNDYEKKFTRPEWKKLEVLDENLIFFRRIAIYKGEEFDQYSQDIVDIKKYRNSFKEHKYFYKTLLDFNFDDKNETIIRIFKDGTKPNKPGYSKIFIVSMVVIDETNQLLDINKSKILRQPFTKMDDVYNNLETDTNLFFYNKKIYIDALYRGELNSGCYKPKLKISELSKNGQKEICSFELVRKIQKCNK